MYKSFIYLSLYRFIINNTQNKQRLIKLCTVNHRKRVGRSGNNNVCSLHSHSMWPEDILLQLLTVLEFTQPLMPFSPYSSRHVPQRKEIMFIMKHLTRRKNFTVREWCTDLLSLYNTKQWDRPKNKWWNKQIFICKIVLSEQLDHRSCGPPDNM